MAGVREYQLRFNIEETETIKQDVEKACTNVYEQANSLLDSFGVELPKEKPKYREEISYDADSKIFIGASYKSNLDLRLRDVEIPEELRAAADDLIKQSPWGDKTFLSLIHSDLELYAGKRINIDEELESWSRREYLQKLEEDPEFEGWSAQVGVWGLEKPYDLKCYYFNFNPKGRLISLSIDAADLGKTTTKFHERPLGTKLKFRGNKLVSLKKEYRNGSLFDDPRGKKTDIWPQWIKESYADLDVGHFEQKRLSMESDWQNYLQRVRLKIPVVSGRTKNFVLQTEKQARDNLDHWRDYIYYYNPQSIHFYTTGKEPGFVCKRGYSRFGKFGEHIANNGSYKELDWPDTKNLLAYWDF